MLFAVLRFTGISLSYDFFEINNFKQNPNRINYIYVLTPKGIAHKAKLTANFMQRKMQEYDELKKELLKEQ